MRITKLFFLIFIGLMLVTSCNKEDDFKVKLSATLINKGSTTAIEGEEKEIIYEVILSRTVNARLELTFDVTEDSKNKDYFTIENPVIIEKGNTTGTLKVKILEKPDVYKELTEETKFSLNLKSVQGIEEKIAFDTEAYGFTIAPKENVTPLTEEQRNLLKHYEKNGINIAKWIGKIPVRTTVVTGGDGTIDAFSNPQTIDYEGYVEITLSENATEERPLLKMTKNAFGLAEYLQWVFRNETIENTEYWYLPDNPYAPPSPLAVLEALGKEKTQKWINKEYSFDVSVDNIELNPDGTITFVRENGTYDTYTNFLDPERTKNLSAVDFEYHFPLWDELAELAKDNSDLQTNIITGGSIHPNNYIGYSTILSNDWGGSSWVAPEGTYNNTEMTFIFNTDHANSGAYDKVSVILTSPN